MNGDPYRNAPQPADRRVINRSGAAYRPADEPQPVKEEAPKSTPRSSGAHHADYSDKKPRKGLGLIVSIVLVVIIIGIVGWFVWSNSKKTDIGIDSSRYQAVFMANGQIYFGKLTAFNNDSFKITHIYYPQAQATDGSSSKNSDATQQSNIQLFRVTDGVHGPEDEMVIMKDQVLYYENLQANSKVTQLIDQNEKK